MKFDEIKRIVHGVPYISDRNAKFLYDLILNNQITNILELGVAHGAATCYMAAALHELGAGSITSVDLLEVKEHFKPSPEEMLSKSGLATFAKIARMQSGYTWFLHDEIKRSTINDTCNPSYDLCIIDGPKNWTIDGCAFFLADKLLKENGLIIFDDYLWTYAESAKAKQVSDGITHRSLSEDELTTPQVREIFELLVKQHPNYTDFIVRPDDGWAMARKMASDKKAYAIQYTETNRDILVRLKKKIQQIVSGKRNK